MTRKHFKAIALAIAMLPSNPTKDQVIVAIADVCRMFNPHFDTYRFYAACKE
jgi:hypothetical protein